MIEPIIGKSELWNFREHFVDTTRAISEGTGEKDTKKALEFRRKEVKLQSFLITNSKS